jgi:hypothetical protein
MYDGEGSDYEPPSSDDDDDKSKCKPGTKRKLKRSNNETPASKRSKTTSKQTSIDSQETSK